MVICVDDDYILINNDTGNIEHRVFEDDLSELVHEYHRNRAENWARRIITKETDHDYADIKAKRASKLFMEMMGSEKFEEHLKTILNECIAVAIENVEIELEFLKEKPSGNFG